MTPLKAMILAAGRGERMRPLTDHCPKPLLEVGGKPLIVWHLERLAAAGTVDVVINHAHLGWMFEQALGDGARFGLRIRYSAEATALETAGGIAQALPLLQDPAEPASPFMVLNGDVFSDFDLRRAATIAQQMRDYNLDAWCVLIDNPVHHPGGDFSLSAGHLGNDPPRLTYSGIGVYQPRLFASIGQGMRAPLAPLLRAAANRDQAGGERLIGTWVDVGTVQRLAELDAQLRQRTATTRPPGVAAADPAE